MPSFFFGWSSSSWSSKCWEPGNWLHLWQDVLFYLAFKFPPTRSKHHTLPCHNNIIHPMIRFEGIYQTKSRGVLEGIPATFGLLLWLWWWCILKPGPQWFRSTKNHRNFGPTPLGSWVWCWLCYVNNVIYIKLLITMYLQVITDMKKL